MSKLRLGVNIDHVATIRNARGGHFPDPVRAAKLAVAAGADGITAHLREDRRHISDHDIKRLAREIPLPLNLEMAATEEMLEIALCHKPNACCLVPERREELTTEGGLDVASARGHLGPYVKALKGKGIRVSMFIDPDKAQLDAAAEIGADIVELHTGAYCDAMGAARGTALARIAESVEYGAALGLEIHAGHGLSFETVGEIAALQGIVELNIGHFLVGEAIFTGLESSIRQMRVLMDEARGIARSDASDAKSA
ncbi:MAG: pyridoxine 5'-phosphate synthase [Proteobacteria bacterium]|nr:pyridoxine 5'-phosphate synthase [Pseudomonadota bacterium]